MIPSPLIPLIERLGGRTGILAYHGVGSGDMWRSMHLSAEDLRRQLEMLVQHYTPLRLTEYADRVRRGASLERCVAVTFDDAYAGVVTEAAPILRELGVPATVFVASDFASGGRDFWWDRFYPVVHGDDGRLWERLALEAGLTGIDRQDPLAVEQLRGNLLAAQAGRVDLPDAPAPGEPWRSATFPELRKLAEWEGIDFGVHTRTHPLLPALPADERVSEIAGCADILRDNLPRVVPLLAYPYGIFDRDSMTSALSAGMTASFSMQGLSPARRPSLQAIPRIGVGGVHSNSSIRLRLSRLMRRPLILRTGNGTDPSPHADDFRPAPHAIAGTAAR